MPGATVRMGVGGAGGFRRAAGKLRQAAARLPGEMNRALDPEGRRAAVAVRAAAVSLPGGRTHSGLRRGIAGATVTRPAAGGIGFSVRVDPGLMPPGQAVLPEIMNTRPWRHPTFGHAPIVEQVSRPGWFDQAVSGRERTIEAALERAVRRVID